MEEPIKLQCYPIPMPFNVINYLTSDDSLLSLTPEKKPGDNNVDNDNLKSLDNLPRESRVRFNENIDLHLYTPDYSQSETSSYESSPSKDQYNISNFLLDPNYFLNHDSRNNLINLNSSVSKFDSSKFEHCNPSNPCFPSKDKFHVEKPSNSQYNLKINSIPIEQGLDYNKNSLESNLTETVSIPIIRSNKDKFNDTNKNDNNSNENPLSHISKRNTLNCNNLDQDKFKSKRKFFFDGKFSHKTNCLVKSKTLSNLNMTGNDKISARNKNSSLSSKSLSNDNLKEINVKLLNETSNPLNNTTNIMIHPSLNTTLKLALQSDMLKRNEFHRDKFLKENINSKLLEKIEEKALSKLNIFEPRFVGLTSLQISEGEIIKKIESTQISNVRPMIDNREKIRIQEIASPLPDIMAFFSSSFICEPVKNTFNNSLLNGKPKDNSVIKSCDITNSFDLYRHIQSWNKPGTLF